MKKHSILLLIFYCITINFSFSSELKPRNVTFKILTFNLWVGGDGSGFTMTESVSSQLKTIRSTKADVVAFQEQTSYKFGQHDRAKLLADSLKWNCIVIDKSRAVISKYPLERLTIESSQILKLTIQGKEILIADVHFQAYPYEPYDIADGKITNENDAIKSAINTRGKQIQSILDDRKGFESFPMLVLGDFNEPSYYDWTVENIKKRNDPRLKFSVKWPSSSLLLEAGFYDVFRAIYKNVQKKPAYTWTSIPGGSIPNEVYDRIDLIYANKQIKVKSVAIVGENIENADFVITPWVTDHRAVLAEFSL